MHRRRGLTRLVVLAVPLLLLTLLAASTLLADAEWTGRPPTLPAEGKWAMRIALPAVPKIPAAIKFQPRRSFSSFTSLSMDAVSHRRFNLIMASLFFEQVASLQLFISDLMPLIFSKDYKLIFYQDSEKHALSKGFNFLRGKKFFFRVIKAVASLNEGSLSSARLRERNARSGE